MKQDMSIPSEYEQQYRQIHWLLKNCEWEKANQLTLKIVDKLGLKEENMPCQELRVLDEYWNQYSNGRFGFSAQIKIFREIWTHEMRTQQRKVQNRDQDQMNYKELNAKSAQRFVETVGWYDKVKNSYFCWKDLKFNLEDAPPGNLPSYLIRLDSQLDYEQTQPPGLFYCSIVLDKIGKCDLPNLQLPTYLIRT